MGHRSAGHASHHSTDPASHHKEDNASHHNADNASHHITGIAQQPDSLGDVGAAMRKGCTCTSLRTVFTDNSIYVHGLEIK